MNVGHTLKPSVSLKLARPPSAVSVPLLSDTRVADLRRNGLHGDQIRRLRAEHDAGRVVAPQSVGECRNSLNIHVFVDLHWLMRRRSCPRAGPGTIQSSLRTLPFADHEIWLNNASAYIHEVAHVVVARSRRGFRFRSRLRLLFWRHGYTWLCVEVLRARKILGRMDGSRRCKAVISCRLPIQW